MPRENLSPWSGIKSDNSLMKLVSECEFAKYQPRFDFYGIAERSVRTNIGKEMDKAIGRALRSAK